MNRGDLTNEPWIRLELLLPPQKPKTGRPNLGHRRMRNGMLWILRTGAPWRDRPKRYGAWRSVASRFYRWRARGVWGRALWALPVQADLAGRREWEAHLVEATLVRAHPHAAGAKKGADESAKARAAVEGLGYSQGGFSTKVPRRTEGQAMGIVLTPAHQWRRLQRRSTFRAAKIREFLNSPALQESFASSKLVDFIVHDPIGWQYRGSDEYGDWISMWKTLQYREIAGSECVNSFETPFC